MRRVPLGAEVTLGQQVVVLATVVGAPAAVRAALAVRRGLAGPAAGRDHRHDPAEVEIFILGEAGPACPRRASGDAAGDDAGTGGRGDGGPIAGGMHRRRSR